MSFWNCFVCENIEKTNKWIKLCHAFLEAGSSWFAFLEKKSCFIWDSGNKRQIKQECVPVTQFFFIAK